MHDLVYPLVLMHAIARVTVEVRSNDTAADAVVEDPQVVIGLLEDGLLAWADGWAANVLPGDKVTIDEANTT